MYRQLFQPKQVRLHITMQNKPGCSQPSLSLRTGLQAGLQSVLCNLLLPALLLSSSFLTACNQPATGTLPVIKIGSASPLTGPQAHLGQDNANGARLAVDEINAAGLVIGKQHYRLQLLAEDDQADPRTATTVAQQLVDDGVAGVIGHLNSGATIPAAKVYFDAGIPQISPSATAIAYTHLGFNTAFRVMSNDHQQGDALGQYVAQRLHIKRIAIIDDRTAYGQGLADEFSHAATAAGAIIVDREYTTDKSTDFLAILTAIKAAQPQIIFFGGMDPQAGPLARQIQQLGIHSPLIGGDGMQTEQFIRLAGQAAEGDFASNPGVPLDKMPQGAAFAKRFRAQYGEIQNYAPYAYDAVYVMIDAMQRAGSPDPARYLAELPKTDYRGVTGHIRFDSHGDLAHGRITIYQVKSGHWQPVETLNGT